MTEVIVERDWQAPLTDAAVGQMFDASAGCLDIHRVRWNRSLLSMDGHRLICHFSAADAESVRMAFRQAGAPLGRVWAGTLHDAPGMSPEDLHAANVGVCRRFEAPMAFQDMQALEDAGSACLESHRVRFVRTYFSIDRTRMICLYRAPDAESVRIAQREANMPFEQILPVRQFHP